MFSQKVYCYQFFLDKPNWAIAQDWANGYMLGSPLVYLPFSEHDVPAYPSEHLHVSLATQAPNSHPGLHTTIVMLLQTQ